MITPEQFRESVEELKPAPSKSTMVESFNKKAPMQKRTATLNFKRTGTRITGGESPAQRAARAKFTTAAKKAGGQVKKGSKLK